MASEVDNLRAQIQQIENQLLALYNQKTNLIADREVYRFHYLSVWRAQLIAEQTKIDGFIMKTNNNALKQYWSVYSSFLHSLFPMANYNASYDGSGIADFRGEGYLYREITPNMKSWFGLLGVLEDLLINPTSFSDTRPVYQSQMNNSVNRDILSDVSLFGADLRATNDFVNYYDIADIINRHASPISFSGLSEASKADAINLMKYYVGQPSDAVSTAFLSVVEQGRQLYHSVMQSTQDILRTQLQIDQLESSASDLVTQFKQASALAVPVTTTRPIVGEMNDIVTAPAQTTTQATSTKTSGGKALAVLGLAVVAGVGYHYLGGNHVG